MKKPKTRVCSRCKNTKPATEFRTSGSICADCETNIPRCSKCNRAMTQLSDGKWRCPHRDMPDRFIKGAGMPPVSQNTEPSAEKAHTGPPVAICARPGCKNGVYNAPQSLINEGFQFYCADCSKPEAIDEDLLKAARERHSIINASPEVRKTACSRGGVAKAKRKKRYMGMGRIPK